MVCLNYEHIRGLSAHKITLYLSEQLFRPEISVFLGAVYWSNIQSYLYLACLHVSLLYVNVYLIWNVGY